MSERLFFKGISINKSLINQSISQHMQTKPRKTDGRTAAVDIDRR